MTNNQTQTIRLIDFHNRYVDLQMKGTWGYNPRNIAMLTAESTIEELEVTDTKALDDNGSKLNQPLVIGTDKYGRHLEIPVDRILAVGFLNTKEQAQLKGLKWLIEAYGNVPSDVVESNESLKNMITDSKQRYDELVAKGVTIYQRRG